MGYLSQGTRVRKLDSVRQVDKSAMRCARDRSGYELRFEFLESSN